MTIASERVYPTPLNSSTLLPLLLMSLATQRHTPHSSDGFQNEYDYIIVGSGAAGSVVASRLSEDPCSSVLLLEAGHEPPLLTEVPALGRYFWGTDVDWQFHTVPQIHAGSGLVNRKIGWTTGKMVGGSASLNSMGYVRGNKRNYDDWAAQGATGWSYDEVLPYFLKLEDNTDAALVDNVYHTTGGPVTVEKPKYQSAIKSAVYEAATGMGYEFVDPNGPWQTGFYDRQANIRGNQRCSSVKAYLVPAENRTNLDILLNAMVTKVSIEDGQATGVQFDYKGFRYEVKAKKEVIVSAGAVNTPKLLMLSGIGPKEELQKFGIPVNADLPVGKNFHDHGGTSYFFTLDPDGPTFNEKLADPNYILQYIDSRTGPLASTDGYYEIAFLQGMQIYPLIDFPNFALYFGEHPISFIKGAGLMPEVYDQVVKPYENRTIFACSIQQLQPRSRGTVTLLSTNPYDPPLIDPNYLQDPRDLEDIVQGLKVCKKLIESEPFKKLGARAFSTTIPGCEGVKDVEDEYFRCAARSVLFTFSHPAGACKMGNPEDPTTVVDPELRVKKTKGLRVIDGSIMPTVVSGNTNIPIIMIAEKASASIKQTSGGCAGASFFSFRSKIPS